MGFHNQMMSSVADQSALHVGRFFYSWSLLLLLKCFNKLICEREKESGKARFRTTEDVAANVRDDGISILL